MLRESEAELTLTIFENSLLSPPQIYGCNFLITVSGLVIRKAHRDDNRTEDASSVLFGSCSWEFLVFEQVLYVNDSRESITACVIERVIVWKKKGEKYKYEECGLVVVVDDACGCSACDLMCCGEPMKPVKKEAKGQG